MRPRPIRTTATLVGSAALLLAACGSDPAVLSEDLDRGRLRSASPPVPTAPVAPPTPPTPPTPVEPSAPVPQSTRAPDRAAAPGREPVRSFLTVPALGLRDFPVVRYVGSPDDAPGTAIQNAGPMASPRGPAGGVGPGVVGNFLVTGHRTSHTMPFADLPSLRAGDRVEVRSGGTELVYEITRTRWTSFRSPRSLDAQSAPVPGRPGQEATRAMITLSTCATPEDHARGNYWSDRFGNPEHRIDKIGVLVDERQTR